MKNKRGKTITVYTKEDVTNAIMMHVKENQLMKGNCSQMCGFCHFSYYPRVILRNLHPFVGNPLIPRPIFTNVWILEHNSQENFPIWFEDRHHEVSHLDSSAYNSPKKIVQKSRKKVKKSKKSQKFEKKIKESKKYQKIENKFFYLNFWFGFHVEHSGRYVRL